MHALRAALRDDPAITLDSAALDIAALERPDLDPAPYHEILDRMAAELATRLADGAGGSRFVQLANRYLFEELGFRGNHAEYYDPRNSCLDTVLDRRTGIPITLSVVYLEVARRLGRPVSGIGLPGHFVVRYDDGEYFTYIDPFHRGRLLGEDDCRKLVREATGVDLPMDPSLLAPVGVRYILVRMLNNLRSAYFRSAQHAKAAMVLDVLLQAFPTHAEYYKARGLARLHLRQLSAAKSDLESYLRYQPEAQDRKEIVQQLETIHRWLSRLN